MRFAMQQMMMAQAMQQGNPAQPGQNTQPGGEDKRMQGAREKAQNASQPV